MGSSPHWKEKTPMKYLVFFFHKISDVVGSNLCQVSGYYD